MHIRGRSKKAGWIDGWLGPNITHVYAESLAEKPKYTRGDTISFKELILEMTGSHITKTYSSVGKFLLANGGKTAKQKLCMG